MWNNAQKLVKVPSVFINMNFLLSSFARVYYTKVDSLDRRCAGSDDPNGQAGDRLGQEKVRSWDKSDASFG